MKNIHILPTDKPSRLYYHSDLKQLVLTNKTMLREFVINQNIYITSNSKFVRDEYITDGIEVIKATPKLVNAQGLVDRRDWKKIIITTDQELIKDGVHSIGEEFLKWFVENPTCIKVEVVYGLFNPMGRQVDPNDLGQNHSKCVWKYKIITTKEEPKLQCKDCNDNLTDCTCIEDTVDMKQTPGKETADYIDRHIVEAMVEVAKQKMYSEEDMKSSFQVGFNVGYNDEESPSYLTFEEWIKEYKKK
jgi:hypothetical protein